MNEWLFLLLAVIILLAALVAVSLRNLIHSVLSLIVVFLGTAAVYVGLEAPFIAAIQVLIYIGAIAILLLFALMLIRRDPARVRSALTMRTWVAVGISGAIFVILAAITATIERTLPAPSGVPEVDALGRELLQQWVVPFEVASLLLTAAMIGAIAVALEYRRVRRKEVGR
jgi:NADH-quinone oxidoreductase subunit J